MRWQPRPRSSHAASVRRARAVVLRTCPGAARWPNRQGHIDDLDRSLLTFREGLAPAATGRTPRVSRVAVLRSGPNSRSAELRADEGDRGPLTRCRVAAPLRPRSAANLSARALNFRAQRCCRRFAAQPQMHPFRSVAMPRDPSIVSAWPLVASVFDNNATPPADPVIPDPVRSASPGDARRKLDIDALTEQYWLPFDNTHLAINMGVRVPNPSAARSAEPRPRPKSVAVIGHRPRRCSPPETSTS